MRVLGSACITAAVAIFAFVPQTLLPAEGTPNWLFFDGVCNLCDGFVNFVADGDSARRVQFGAIQKHTELLAQRGASAGAGSRASSATSSSPHSRERMTCRSSSERQEFESESEEAD